MGYSFPTIIRCVPYCIWSKDVKNYKNHGERFRFLESLFRSLNFLLPQLLAERTISLFLSFKIRRNSNHLKVCMVGEKDREKEAKKRQKYVVLFSYTQIKSIDTLFNSSLFCAIFSL